MKIAIKKNFPLHVLMIDDGQRQKIMAWVDQVIVLKTAADVI